MQTLVVINKPSDSIIIQTESENYVDTYSNFIYKDNGLEADASIQTMDYNEYTNHCLVNGDRNSSFMSYAKSLLSNVKTFIESKQKRDKEAEDKRTEETFKKYDEDAKKAEEERLANMTEEERQEEMIRTYSDYAESYMDEQAQTRRYDDMDKLCGYVTSTREQFRKEAIAANKYRDEVWDTCYRILDMAKAGQIEIPTKEGFIAMLPVFDWGESETK